MRDDVARGGDEQPQAVGFLLNALHPVVDVVNLAPAVDLAHDRLAQHVVAPFDNVRLDRLSILRRRLDHADVPHTRERHVQRARDRGRGH